MKIKSDFVTNSSSSSFVIGMNDLTGWQLRKIHEHAILAGDEAWEIYETSDYVRGYTIMDNFDMQDYLESLHVDMKKVIWNRD